jgi:TolB protein
VAKQTRILGEAKIAPGAAARDVAHQIADAVYEKVLGVRGAFWTRIAYVTASGTGANRHYALMVADSDGFNAQSVVSSPQPLLSPVVESGRQAHCLRQFRSRKQLHLHPESREQRTRTDRQLPRNQRRAEFLARRQQARDDAVAQRQPRDLRDGPGQQAIAPDHQPLRIDTEAVWSADGGTLYFTSDRGGRPQIYQASAAGGGATRLTFSGNYNARATVSADGKKIATAQGNGNSYRIAVMDRALGNRWTALSPATSTNRRASPPTRACCCTPRRGRTQRAVHRVRRRTRTSAPACRGANVQEPAWGPYRQKR